jgi:hypothetical protein
MSNQFKQAIQEYISIDDKIRNYEKEIKMLRNERSKFEQFIVGTIHEKGLTDKDIKLGNNLFRFDTYETKSSFSQSHVKNSLIAYFIEKYSDRLSQHKCEEKALEIFNYILDNREIREKSTLKRIVN